MCLKNVKRIIKDFKTIALIFYFYFLQAAFFDQFYLQYIIC